MPNYTVQDTQTGKTVTFQWDGIQPPTDADMEQVFAAVRTASPERPPVEFPVYDYPGDEPALRAGASLLFGGLGAYGGSKVAGLKGALVGGAAGNQVAQRGIDALQGKGIDWEKVVDEGSRDITAGALLSGIPFAGALQGYGPVDLARKAGLTGNRMAERLYSSSVKMPLSRKWTAARSPEEQTRVQMAVEKGLSEKVPPSELGIAQAQAGKRAAGDRIGSAVEGTAGVVDTDTLVGKGLEDVIRYAQKSEAPAADVARIQEYATAFKEGRAAQLTAKELQEIKTTLYRLVDYDKSGRAADSLKEMMRKGIAHQARTKLEEMNPALKALNQDWAKWDALQEALERAVPRMNNRDVVGLGTKVLVGREAWPLAIINATIGHPSVKSKIAFMLYKGKQSAGTFVPPKSGGGLLGGGGGGASAAKEAERLGIQYIPEWSKGGVKYFQDPVSGGSFSVKGGETVEEGLTRLRESLKGTPSPFGGGLLTPISR